MCHPRKLNDASIEMVNKACNRVIEFLILRLEDINYCHDFVSEALLVNLASLGCSKEGYAFAFDEFKQNGLNLLLTMYGQYIKSGS